MGKMSEGGNAPERPGEIMAHLYMRILHEVPFSHI